ncbi:hypothetical protein CYMTET_22547, partial [Cymbomonas tetramitiformis]
GGGHRVSSGGGGHWARSGGGYWARSGGGHWARSGDQACGFMREIFCSPNIRSGASRAVSQGHLSLQHPSVEACHVELMMASRLVRASMRCCYVAHSVAAVVPQCAKLPQPVPLPRAAHALIPAQPRQHLRIPLVCNLPNGKFRLVYVYTTKAIDARDGPVELLTYYGETNVVEAEDIGVV